jgi:CRISPR-associated protein Cas1
MINHVVDLSERPARLRVRYNQLVIERENEPDASVPLAELAVLIVAHPQVRYTQAVLAGLSAAGGVFVACDEHHLPVGILLPLVGHHLQSERFAAQARAPLPLRKRLWRQIVRAKILAQARLLTLLRRADHGLPTLATQVRSGDPANVEAQASRRYWTALFANAGFRRDRDAEDQNRLLNYGYGVLRAVVARAICAAGLHPSLGLHHHNRYNAFCLADDLMEPFRPLVDRAVVRVVEQFGPRVELGPECKRQMLCAVTSKCRVGDEQRTLFDALAQTAASLAGAYLGEQRRLKLPEIPYDE